MSSMTGTRERQRDRDTYHRMKLEEWRHIIKIDKEKDVLKDRKERVSEVEKCLFFHSFSFKGRGCGRTERTERTERIAKPTLLSPSIRPFY